MATITKDYNQIKTFSDGRIFDRYYTLYALFNEGHLLFQEEFDSTLEVLRDLPREKKRRVYCLIGKLMNQQAREGNFDSAANLKGALDYYHAFVLD